MNRRRTLTLAILSALAVIAAAARRPRQPAGLDPAVDARVKADFETIRQADANRKTRLPEAGALPTRSATRCSSSPATCASGPRSTPFRRSSPSARRRRRTLEGRGGEARRAAAAPLLAEQALKELPAVVPDAARRTAGREGAQEPPERREGQRRRPGGREGRRSSRSSRPDVERWRTSSASSRSGDDKQAKLDDKLVGGPGRPAAGAQRGRMAGAGPAHSRSPARSLPGEADAQARAAAPRRRPAVH